MADIVKCKKCGKLIKANGMGPHLRFCRGPVAPKQLCGVNGCIREAGHTGRHYRKHKAGREKAAGPADKHHRKLGVEDALKARRNGGETAGADGGFDG